MDARGTHTRRRRAQSRSRRTRARIVAALGPLTILAGLGWAVAQPYRLTLLHPHGQGFWWLVSEPPLFVILAGLRFPDSSRAASCVTSPMRSCDADAAARRARALVVRHRLSPARALLRAAALVGPEIWRRRPWRAYLFPGLLFALGVLMWPVMVFYTNSTIHMLAHGLWAQGLMLAGAAELGLARGKLQSRYWRLCASLALLVSGAALLVHEQNPWLYQRSAFLHHALGWVAIVGAIFPFLQAFRPRSLAAATGFADVPRHARSSSTATATSRRSSVTSRRLPGCRTGESRSIALAVVAAASLAAPATAFAHATLEHDVSVAARARSHARRAGRLALRPERLRGSRIHPGSQAERRQRRSCSACRRTRARCRRCRGFARGRTRFAGARSRTTGTWSRASSRLACAMPAPPVTEAVGAQGPTRTEDIVRWAYFLALALLVGGLGTRLLIARGPLPARARAAVLLARRHRGDRRARSRNPRVPASCGRCVAAPFGRLPLRRSLAALGRDALRADVHRDDPRVCVHARVPLPRVADRSACLPLGRRSGLRLSSRRGCRSPVTLPASRTRRGSASSPTTRT